VGGTTPKFVFQLLAELDTNTGYLTSKPTQIHAYIHTLHTRIYTYIHTYIRTYIHYTYNLNEVIPLCIDSIYSLYYIYCSQHNYIIKAQVKATCFDLKVIVRLS